VIRDFYGNTVMRQSAAGEYRQLLPANQAVHKVHGGDPGFDEIAGPGASDRIERQPFDPKISANRDWRAAVDHPADAVVYPAQDTGAQTEMQGFEIKVHDRIAKSKAGARFEQFDREEFVIDRGNAPKSNSAVAAVDRDGVV
jgi:hypothetical protein